MKVVAMLLMLVGLCSCTQVPAGTPSITSNPEAICTIGGEVGYGQLYPMVKRYDYEKALRIYEQEQKETSMEGQE